MSIRTRLLLLAVMVLVPTALSALWAFYLTVENERAASQSTLRETTRALALVVDG